MAENVFSFSYTTKTAAGHRWSQLVTSGHILSHLETCQSHLATSILTYTGHYWHLLVTTFIKQFVPKMHICQTFRLWSQIWQLLVTLYKKSSHLQHLVTPGNIWSHQLPTFRYILQLLPLEHLPYCHSRLSSLIISFPPLGIFLNTKWCRFLQSVSHHMRVCFQIRIVFPLQTLMCRFQRPSLHEGRGVPALQVR